MLRKSIRFESRKLRKEVKGWLKDADWNIRDFAYFLNNEVKLELPVVISKVGSYTSMLSIHSDVTEEQVILHQYYGYSTLTKEFILHIRIMRGSNTKCYKLGVAPEVQYTGSISEIDGRRVEMMYDVYNQFRYGISYNHREIEITLEKPEKERIREKVQKILEEYVENYDRGDGANKIYKEIGNLLGTVNMMNIPKFIISCIKVSETERFKITRLETEYNKPLKCIATKEKEVYSLYWNATGYSWNYKDTNTGLKLIYLSEKDEYIIKAGWVLENMEINQLWQVRNDIAEIIEMLKEATNF